MNKRKMSNLIKTRKSRNLTQKEIAKLLNIEQTTYSGYETGYSRPDIDTLKKIANIFNTSIDYLVEYTPKNSLQIGYLDDDQKNAIKKLIALNQTNFIKAYSYISGLHAAQN